MSSIEQPKSYPCREILFKKGNDRDKIYQGTIIVYEGMMYVMYWDGLAIRKELISNIVEIPSIEVIRKSYHVVVVEDGFGDHNVTKVQEAFNQMTKDGWVYRDKLSSNVLLFEKDVKKLKAI